MEGEEKSPPEPKGCCGRCRERFEQQEPARNMAPYWMFCWMAQAVSAACCALLLALIGIILILATSSCKETTIDYKYPDHHVDFKVSEKMEGTVLMWYDLPDVYLNQKRYVENKDNDVIKPFIIGANTCEQAEDVSDVTWRRVELEKKIREKMPQPDTPIAADRFSIRVKQSELSNVFKPCGLNSISMFSDEYRIETSSGANVRLDESDIVLEYDEDIYTKKIDETPAGPNVHFHLKGEKSWLDKGSFYDHWKVWMRSPASPRARQLWATIPDGLEAGDYKLIFVQNSAIWTGEGGWGVDKKSVVLSTANVFGSKGASHFLGIVSLVFAILEGLMAVFFMVTPLLQKEKKDEA